VAAADCINSTITTIFSNPSLTSSIALTARTVAIPKIRQTQQHHHHGISHPCSPLKINIRQIEIEDIYQVLMTHKNNSTS
jgi:hypothetical protein